MEREIMPDYAEEAFCQYLIPPKILEGSGKPGGEANRCVVLCKKVAPNVFDIIKGVAVVEGAKNYFNDEVCMIAPSTKVVFVFK